MSHKRTNGERVGNIQFGYRLCADGKHLEPDSAEQAVLNEIRRVRPERPNAARDGCRPEPPSRGSAWRLERVGRITRQASALR